MASDTRPVQYTHFRSRCVILQPVESIAFPDMGVGTIVARRTDEHVPRTVFPPAYPALTPTNLMLRLWPIGLTRWPYAVIVSTYSLSVASWHGSIISVSESLSRWKHTAFAIPITIAVSLAFQQFASSGFFGVATLIVFIIGVASYRGPHYQNIQSTLCPSPHVSTSCTHTNKLVASFGLPPLV